MPQESLADEINREIVEYAKERNPGANVESLMLDWLDRIIVEAIERRIAARNSTIENETRRLQKLVRKDEA